MIRWHHTKVVSFDLNVLLTLCLLSHHAACITGESNGCLDRRAWLRSPRALVLMVSLPADCFLIDALVYHAAIACSILFCALTFTGLVALDRAPLRQGLLETPVFIVCLLVVSLLYCQIMAVHWFVAPRSYSHVSCIDKCIDLGFHSRAPSEEPLLPRRSARHGADWTSSSLVLSPRWVWSSLPVFDLRLREVPSSRSTSKVMILVHVLVRVHRDSCVVRIISSIVPRVYKHDILMRRTGLVVCSLWLWFVLLGCVWCVLWVLWPSACCSCWHWLCRGWAGELELDGLAAGGCGRAPRPLARCSPCKLASPIANHEHAPARAAIYSAHLHRRRGLVPWSAVQWAFAAAAAGDVGGGRGRWQQRPAGQQPNCTWRWHSAINSALSVRFGLLFMGRVDEHDAYICEISPGRSRRRTSPHATRRGHARETTRPSRLEDLLVRSCQQNAEIYGGSDATTVEHSYGEG